MGAAVSLGGAFVSMEISISYLLYFSSFSFCLAWAFISLQIQEFWLFGVHINDNIFASLFLFIFYTNRTTLFSSRSRSYPTFPSFCLAWASTALLSRYSGWTYALMSRYSGWTYISISYLLYFSSFSFCLAWAFISLQIQEFWLFGVHINDNIFASLFFTLTGLFGTQSVLSSASSYLCIYHFVVALLGILLTFVPMHFLGFNLMPRRIPDFPDTFHSWNFLSSIGSGITLLS